MSNLLKWLIGAAALVACLWVGLQYESCTDAKKVAQHVQQATQDHAAAVIDAQKGATHDQQAQAQADQTAKDAATVAQLRAELARLRKAPAVPPQPPSPGPAQPEPQPVAPPVDLAAVVAKQDAIIDAQAKQIDDQAAQIHTLTLARDDYKAAYTQSAAEAVQLRAALAAAEGLARTQRWEGRIEGVVVGLGGGFVAGRFLK